MTIATAGEESMSNLNNSFISRLLPLRALTPADSFVSAASCLLVEGITSGAAGRYATGGAGGSSNVTLRSDWQFEKSSFELAEPVPHLVCKDKLLLARHDVNTEASELLNNKATMVP